MTRTTAVWMFSCISALVASSSCGSDSSPIPPASGNAGSGETTTTGGHGGEAGSSTQEGSGGSSGSATSNTTGGGNAGSDINRMQEALRGPAEARHRRVAGSPSSRPPRP